MPFIFVTVIHIHVSGLDESYNFYILICDKYAAIIIVIVYFRNFNV